MMGCSAPGTTYSPLSGKLMPVHSSQSATVPMTVTVAGAIFRNSAPSLQGTRSQGSKGDPSSRFQPTYCSKGVNGYELFRVGRTGATRECMPRSAASERMARRISALRPRLWWLLVTMAARAESVFGVLRSWWARNARSRSSFIVAGRPCGVPSQTRGTVCPTAITASAGSRKRIWYSAKSSKSLSQCFVSPCSRKVGQPSSASRPTCSASLGLRSRVVILRDTYIGAQRNACHTSRSLNARRSTLGRNGKNYLSDPLALLHVLLGGGGLFEGKGLVDDRVQLVLLVELQHTPELLGGTHRGAEDVEVLEGDADGHSFLCRSCGSPEDNDAATGFCQLDQGVEDLAAD